MKFSTLNLLKTLVLAALLLIALAGCATIEGAGKDIESAGEAVQDAAN
jgi:predicted small secreted protein